MRIFVTGGTGLVGTRLIRALRARGDDVTLLTRRSGVSTEPGVKVVVGDPSVAGPWRDAIAECDAVVNLVGEGIFNRRWSTAFKETMRRSRVDATRNVADAMQATPRRADGSPKVLVSASAIGIYGPHGDETLVESNDHAHDFLAKLCVDWELATCPAIDAGVRVVCLRVGVVLDPGGGALSKMLTPFKMFVGGPVGSGRQYMSWIHHADLVGMILFALDDPRIEGPLNGVAPQPATNREFSTELGKALGRPSFLPTPAFALRLALGEVANVVTQGQRVMPQKALDNGFRFRYPDLAPALADVVK